jgi:hypothetical protein
MQRPCIDLGADRHAFGLLVVGGEVFDCGHHALALHALDVGHGRARGEFGIFAVVLEVAATQRRARDVHRRTENDILPVPLGLASDGRAHAFHQRGIEGRGQEHARGKGGGLAHAHPDGTIGHAQGRDT